MSASCNCVVLWNYWTQRHEWIRAALSSCEHPATGTGYDEEWKP